MSFRGVAPPFQLLEINIISAQELAPVSRRMHSYAVAWVHPDRKLSTRIDTLSHVNPTWNDKFVFRVDDDFLSCDTSAVMIQIYAVRFFRDVLVGSVRVLVGNLIPPSTTHHQKSGMRFVALQVRRPSGRPQGILNIGVALLDGSMRSMPLYTHLNNLSAVGYRDLMGEEQYTPNHHQHQNHLYLRRTRSERTSNVTDNDFGEPPLAMITAGSVWSESDVGPAPSVVAAAVAEELFPVSTKNNNMEGRNEDKSIEQLRLKLERWKTELPPIYDDRVDHNKYGTSSSSKDGSKHARRHTDGGGGGGLLSCFGDSYGCEVSISCGLKPARKSGRSGRNNGRSGSDDDDDEDDDDEISKPYIIPVKR